MYKCNDALQCMHGLTIKTISLVPGHSQVFNVTCKTWKWPGDEANYLDRHDRIQQ